MHRTTLFHSPPFLETRPLCRAVGLELIEGAAVLEWLSSWFAEQEVWGSIPGLAAATISKIGYLLLPSRHVAEILLKRRGSSKQPTNQQPTNLSKSVEASFCISMPRFGTIVQRWFIQTYFIQ